MAANERHQSQQARADLQVIELFAGRHSEARQPAGGKGLGPVIGGKSC